MYILLEKSASLSQSTMTFGERALDALVMLIKGMVMVFLVLAVLMAVLMIMERVFAKKQKKTETENKEVAPVAVNSEEPSAPAEDDGAIIAAITAAIAVVMEAEGNPGGFRVVSFKRTGKKSAWNNK